MMAKIWWAALLCGAALAWPAQAQQGGTQTEPPSTPPPETEKKEAPATTAEPAPKKKSSLEDPPLHHWGGFTVSFAGFGVTPVGANEDIAVSFPTGQYPQPIAIQFSGNIRQSASVAYHLPNNYGSIVGHYDSFHNNEPLSVTTPGEFLFGETLGGRLYAGAADNGLADGVAGEHIVKTREARFQYQNTAWDSKHSHATWGAGVVNIDHNNQLQATYYALVPNLPALIPPLESTGDPLRLQPKPDRVLLQSDFSGTGFSGSLDVEFKLHPRFSVISGISLGLVKGSVKTIYKSFTNYYYNSLENRYVGFDELSHVLQFGCENPADPNDTSCIDAIIQKTVLEGYYQPNVSQAGQAFDGYVGVQSQVWRGLRVFAEFRELYYANVGQFAALNENLTVTKTAKSVGYEGYLVGASWRF